MSNMTTRLILGSGMIVAGAVLISTTKVRRRSLFAIMRKRARLLAERGLRQAHLAKRHAAKFADVAVQGLADAREIGQAAYQRVAG